MTKLYVSEFSGLASTVQTSVPEFPAAGLVAEQVVDYTSAVAVSDAFNAATEWVEFATDAICSFLISEDGTDAAATNMRMAAGERLKRRVQPGWYISAITNT